MLTCHAIVGVGPYLFSRNPKTYIRCVLGQQKREKIHCSLKRTHSLRKAYVKGCSEHKLSACAEGNLQIRASCSLNAYLKSISDFRNKSFPKKETFCHRAQLLFCHISALGVNAEECSAFPFSGDRRIVVAQKTNASLQPVSYE